MTGSRNLQDGAVLALALLLEEHARVGRRAPDDLATLVVGVRRRCIAGWLPRSGTAVAQIGFIGADGADLSAAQFRALCTRAMQRLDQLPAPVAAG